MDNPPVITYGVIKEIVAAFKQIAAEEYGLILTAGATLILDRSLHIRSLNTPLILRSSAGE